MGLPRAAVSGALLAAALALSALVLLIGAVPGTYALINARTTSVGNSFATAALYPPASVTATASGADVRLGWGAGTNGSGYKLEVGANGASADCANAPFVPLASTAATTYTDVGRSSPAGTFVCYRVSTTYPSAWTSVQANPVAAVQIGFVASTVQLVNNGNHGACSGSGAGTFGQAGRLDCGDQIVIAFNQPLDPATIPSSSATVCASQNSGVVWLGSTTTSGTCRDTEPVRLGALTGGGIDDCDCRFAATYALGSANTTLTVTIGRQISGGNGNWPALGSAAWTFGPTTDTARLRAAANGAHVCSSNGGGARCRPSTPSGSTL